MLEGSRFATGAGVGPGVLEIGAGVSRTGPGVLAERGQGCSPPTASPGAGSVSEPGSGLSFDSMITSMDPSEIEVASSSSGPTAASPVPEGGFVDIPDTLLGGRASSVSGGDVKRMTRKSKNDGWFVVCFVVCFVACFVAKTFDTPGAGLYGPAA